MTSINNTLDLVKFVNDEYDNVKKAVHYVREYKDNLLEFCLAGKITEMEFYKTTSLLSSQSRSPLWEKYYIRKHNGSSVPKKKNRGDFEIDGVYYEYKVSCNDDCELHVVQVRLWQDCNYVIQSIQIDIQDIITFILTHDQMEYEMEIIGTSAHGNISANANNENIELRATIKRNKEDWKRWKTDYAVPNES